MADSQVHAVQAITLLHINLVRHAHLAPIQPAEFLSLQSGVVSAHGAARVRERSLVDRLRLCARDAHAHSAHRATRSLQRRAHLHRQDVSQTHEVEREHTRGLQQRWW